MGRTNDNWSVGGGLEVDGNVEVAGMTFVHNILVGHDNGSFLGDFAVGGDTNLFGGIIIGSHFAVGSSQMNDIYNSTADYSWCYNDGERLILSGLCLYDHHTEDYRMMYLLNGTMTAV